MSKFRVGQGVATRSGGVGAQIAAAEAEAEHRLAQLAKAESEADILFRPVVYGTIEVEAP